MDQFVFLMQLSNLFSVFLNSLLLPLTTLYCVNWTRLFLPWKLSFVTARTEVSSSTYIY